MSALCRMRWRAFLWMRILTAVSTLVLTACCRVADGYAPQRLVSN